jgi:Alpha/beta hydrolase domain
MSPERAPMNRPGVILALALLLGWLGCVTNPAVAAAAAASPTVTGPVTGGNGVPYFVQDLLVGFVVLAALGYEQSEFFITGTANAYASIEPLSPDGKWSVAPSESAAYTTRVVVYRPLKPRRFNGTSDLGVRQPDTNRYQLWEVAGTAHFDAHGLVFGYTDTGDGEGEIAALATMRNPPSSPPPGVFECDLPINAGPMHWVMNAALYRLNRWVVRGTPPRVAPRLQTTAVSPVVFATDAFGNTLGGIRAPQVDVPIATLTGTGNSGQGQFGQFCGAFGTTVPFTESQLEASYENHDQFATQWRRAAGRAVKAGFLLRPDARNLKRAARLSDIGK